MTSKATGFWCMWAVTFEVISGCATVQSARHAYPIDEQGHVSKNAVTRSGLVVSGEELTDLASPNFGALELTFENTSTDWRRIRRVSLDFGGATNNQFIRIPWGDDIRAWYDATVQRSRIHATNRRLATGAVALAGMTVATTSSNETARAVGGIAALGALAGLLAEQSSAAVSSAERVAFFPENHLFAGPFAVPPNLFTKKWVTLNTPGGNVPCIDYLVLTYEFDDRPFERVFLYYKSHSDWQREACLRKARGQSVPVDIQSG